MPALLELGRKAAEEEGCGFPPNLTPEALFKAAGVPFEREIGSGEPASVLVDMAERHGCDAIVLGARGLCENGGSREHEDAAGCGV